MKLGIPVMALFPAIDPALKTPGRSRKAQPHGLIPAGAGLKKGIPSSA